MALTSSSMISLGTQAPNFELLDVVRGENVTLQSIKGNVATVIMFICNHCPYVIHLRSAIAQVAKDYQIKEISFVAISSNDILNYPEDSPDKMKEVAIASGFSFPYLYDDTQAIAKAYEAACTPDIFVFDNALKLAYRGQFDDSRPSNNIKADGKDLRKALDDLLAGRSPHPLQKPSIGCNIKWKTI